jgi:DNA-binding NtrC family response regulator
MDRRKRILIVDDDDRVRLIMSGILKKLGEAYQIVTAGDSRTALDKAQESYYDLLITDLRLPRSDGLALTAAFATISPETKVIWMTAYGCHRFAQASKGLGVYTCLDKPIEIQEIRQAALNALKAEPI